MTSREQRNIAKRCATDLGPAQDTRIARVFTIGVEDPPFARRYLLGRYGQLDLIITTITIVIIVIPGTLNIIITTNTIVIIVIPGLVEPAAQKMSRWRR